MNNYLKNTIRPAPHWSNILARTKLAYGIWFPHQGHYGHEQLFLILGSMAILLTAAGLWWLFSI